MTSQQRADEAVTRIAELEAALKHAHEALYWYDGLGFQVDNDGQTIGQVIERSIGVAT